MSQEITTIDTCAHGETAKYWLAHELMTALGYSTWSTFEALVNKAINSCVHSDIPVLDNFERVFIELDGKQTKSYKLTRFACYLITIHADSNKPEVVKAKTSLAAYADALAASLQESDLHRLDVRGKLSLGEREMCGVASDAGLDARLFGVFKDSGYRGMYNMSLKELKGRRGLGDKDTAYDFMGLEELAGNLFRVTQTKARIENEKIRGNQAIFRTAEQVGVNVRSMMVSNGAVPEDLPLVEKTSSVEKRLRSANRAMLRSEKKQLAVKRNA